MTTRSNKPPLQRRPLLPWIHIWAPIILIGLLLVPRLVQLDVKPLMHDESLFAYYAYRFMQDGRYTHIPMLHSPLLILSTGELFHYFGDTIGVGRAYIALCSILALLVSLAMMPRRVRWLMAPLLITSPVLLYYSRFFRNEMLFCGLLLPGLWGMSMSLRRRGDRAAWAVLGGFGLAGILAVKENAVFVYASGLTFLMVWGIRKWLRPDFFQHLRPRPSPPPHPIAGDDGADRHNGRFDSETYLNSSFESVTDGTRSGKRSRRRGPKRGAATQTPSEPGPMPQAPAVEPVERIESDMPVAIQTTPTRRSIPFRRSIWTAIPGWLVGLILGAILILIVFHVTSSQAGKGYIYSWQDTYKIPALDNIERSWDYWKGQHLEHRISGTIHYYLPIMLTYEMGLLLLVAVGIILDAARRGIRSLVYAGAMLLWFMIWGLWRIVPHSGWLKSAMDFLHVEPNASMLVLGWIIAPILIWSILALYEHRILAAWLGWWTACSLFQYSSAGEKVPWLTVHIVIPMYLMAAWMWAPTVRRMPRRGLQIAVLVIAIVTGHALYNDIRLIGPNKADPRERLVYNHTTEDFDRYCRQTVEKWRENQETIKLSERRVYMLDTPGWPGVWYFRHCYAVTTTSGAFRNIPDHVDLVMGDVEDIENLIEKKRLDPSEWNMVQHPLRRAWLYPWPNKKQNAWLAWWRYYWTRETWYPPGDQFPVGGLEPIPMRR